MLLRLLWVCLVALGSEGVDLDLAGVEVRRVGIVPSADIALTVNEDARVLHASHKGIEGAVVGYGGVRSSHGIIKLAAGSTDPSLSEQR